MAQDTLELFSRLEGLEPNDGDLVIGSDLVVVGLVGECKRKHALLLQVGLVDTGKGLDDDGTAAQVTELAFIKGSFFCENSQNTKTYRGSRAACSREEPSP